MSSCEAPGEGPKAQAGFELLQPVIEALDAYRDRYGTYPGTLDKLVPEFLDQAPESYAGIPIVYEKVADSYWLRFSYERPGINHCTYTTQDQWQCEGYL